ncbi:Putative Holliday junction resolvase [Alteracholeplasma palmae J233]|uniref:Putative pre-16S rRNA nuclease n=1 Tax=Alteracholeplasma palmae (strain ATCC 49389 / J233) TaxID=1318466 RepID=U4KKJ5_ALTPJ|nr:Holliday junction resolvase RuvX [Alteracholeplasma palmae]CCV64269.1 Putative Holliday junction resolvase [Alteracholeplasma palmae J233]
MKKYLGLDLGTKTLGVAISETGIIASNLTTLRFLEDDYDDAITQLISLINERKIDVIVLGYPKHMNNDIGVRGKISEEFKEKLVSRHPIEVVLWDERLSTKTALRMLSDNKKKKEKQRALKDEMAAAVILQGYLDFKGA